MFKVLEVRDLEDYVKQLISLHQKLLFRIIIQGLVDGNERVK